MAINNEMSKLDIFKDTIISEATAETARITRQMKSDQEKALSEARARIRAEAERYENSKKASITARESRRVSTHRNEVRHKQLEFREECAFTVYDMAQALLAEFTASDKYLEHLLTLLDRAWNLIGRTGEVELYLRPADMRFSELLLKNAGDVKISFIEGSFELGGFQLACPKRGIRVDMSFDSSISDIIGRFSEFSGMQVD